MLCFLDVRLSQLFRCYFNFAFVAAKLMLCLQSFAKRSYLKCCILFPIVSSLEVRQLAEGQDVFPYVPYVPGDGGGGGDGSSGHSDSDMDGDGGVAIRGKSFSSNILI